MDDEKQPTRKQSIVRGSLGYHPTIRYPIFTKCRRMFAHVYRNAPLLYRPPGPHPGKPTSPHTPIHMHRHPEHTLAFCSTLFPCAASNQFSFQNKIQAYLLLFIELQNRRKDTIKIFRLKKSVARICEVGEYFSIVNFNEVYK